VRPSENQFNLDESMTSSPETMAHTGEEAPDWDKHYGKAFKLVQTPDGSATDSKTGKSIKTAPGTLSLVTPYNGDAFHAWPEASDEAKSNFKNNWKGIWDSTGGYKQRQVLGAMK
jgi:hypothetical protein